METFRHLRRLHDLIELLSTAATLPLSDAAETKRRTLLAQLTPVALTPEHAASLATGPLPGEISDFLKSLAPVAPQTRRP